MGLSTELERENLFSGTEKTFVIARYSTEEYLVAIGEAVGESGFLRICCRAAGMADSRSFLETGRSGTESRSRRISLAKGLWFGGDGKPCMGIV